MEAQSSEERVKFEPEIEPFRLDSVDKLHDGSSYSLAELLQFHDRSFVINAYAAIAKRNPESEELNQTLDDLRSGRRAKIAIVQDLVARHPTIQVHGLTSPTIRKLTSLPLIGYLLRVLRAVGRLPLLIQHQQQFECYIVGQQQRLAEYLNERTETTATFIDGPNVSSPTLQNSDNVSDVIKTVMMLSDSLIELSGFLAEYEKRLQIVEKHQEKAESAFNVSFTALTEELKKHQQETTLSVQQVQRHLEQAETKQHADLVALTEKLTEQQRRLNELWRAHESAATASREFLVNEQHAIVEAQRAAVTDLQEQVNESSRKYLTLVAELAAQRQEFHRALEEVHQAGHPK